MDQARGIREGRPVVPLARKPPSDALRDDDIIIVINREARPEIQQDASFARNAAVVRDPAQHPVPRAELRAIDPGRDIARRDPRACTAGSGRRVRGRGRRSNRTGQVLAHEKRGGRLAMYGLRVVAQPPAPVPDEPRRSPGARYLDEVTTRLAPMARAGGANERDATNDPSAEHPTIKGSVDDEEAAGSPGTASSFVRGVPSTAGHAAVRRGSASESGRAQTSERAEAHAGTGRVRRRGVVRVRPAPFAVQAGAARGIGARSTGDGERQGARQVVRVGRRHRVAGRQGRRGCEGCDEEAAAARGGRHRATRGLRPGMTVSLTVSLSERAARPPRWAAAPRFRRPASEPA